MPVAFYYIIVIEVVYPDYCGDVYYCQQLFRQQILNKILTHRTIFLTITLDDGQVISFRADLDYLIEYYGEYEYASNDNNLDQRMRSKRFRSSEMLPKSLIFSWLLMFTTVFISYFLYV